MPPDADLAFLHRFEHGCLRLGRRAVDFVRQNHVGENRAFEEPELALAGGGILVNHLGAGDVAGHQVGGELDAFEGKVQRLRQRGNQQRFGQPRHPDQQRVTTGKDGNQHLLDHLFLTDDDLGQLGFDFGAGFFEVLHSLEILIGRRGLRG